MSKKQPSTMNKIGLIGGIGPESTIKYYQLIIEKYRELTNNIGYPEISILSIDMTMMLKYIAEDDKIGFLDFMKERIETLKSSGVNKVFICSNTPHVFYDELQASVDVEIVSIVNETLKYIESLGFKKCGLLGTKFTMSKGFYSLNGKQRGIDIIVPSEEDQNTIHDIYMNELVFNINQSSSKETLLRVINRMVKENSIEGIILGGTELSLILNQSDFEKTTIIDTCLIHVNSIVKALL